MFEQVCAIREVDEVKLVWAGLVFWDMCDEGLVNDEGVKFIVQIKEGLVASLKICRGAELLCDAVPWAVL